jgi:hypothetical protein
MKKLSLIIFVFILFLFGCTQKFDITQFETEGEANLKGDTVYIQITPPWEGFNNPQAIYIGKEPFLYIADTDNDRIIMMNLDGRVLGTRYVRKPIAITQDYKLNLIVCAETEFLNTSNGSTSILGAVFKYDLVASNHNIETAPETRVLPRSADFPNRRYTAVTAFYDNSFYVARTGPNNSSIYDPDNSILIFHPKELYRNGKGDSLIGRVPNINPLGSGLISANRITSLTAFNKRNTDMIVTLGGENSFKAQWFNYQITPIDEKYVSKFLPSDGVAFAVPDRFGNPKGSCIDEAGNMFIADAQKDSIYKFNPFGDEIHSFGGGTALKSPYGVAVFDRVLYVADTGNNRILRYILSTDLK